MDLFEMMRRAGGGEAFDALARQYGVEPDAMERAVEAMMPAFSAGLRRNTADPAGLFDFARAIATGRHTAYYDDPRRAFAAPGVEEGNAILGHLFGSKEVSRAVADQVHRATGLGEAMLKEMLPVIAAMVLGGLYRQGRSANPLLDELLSQLEEGAAPSRRRGPLDRYEDEQEEREARTRTPENAFGRMMEEFAGRTGAAGAPDQARPSGKDVFGELLEPGRRMGEAYRRNMEDIFDRFLSGMDRHR